MKPQTMTEVTARADEIERRRELVADLHSQRITMRAIAERLEVSVGTVHSDLQAMRERWMRAQRDRLGDLITDELSVMEVDERRLRARWNRAQDWREYCAVYKLILDVMRRRAELLGLDAPTVREVYVELSRVDRDELQGRVAAKLATVLELAPESAVAEVLG